MKEFGKNSVVELLRPMTVEREFCQARALWMGFKAAWCDHHAPGKCRALIPHLIVTIFRFAPISPFFAHRLQSSFAAPSDDIHNHLKALCNLPSFRVAPVTLSRQHINSKRP